MTRSSWLVGSSARISRGPVTSARAIATRCAWPPDSSSGMRSARSPTSDEREQLERGVGGDPRGATPIRRSGSATFSSTVNGGSKLGPWNTTPIGPGRRTPAKCRPLDDAGRRLLESGEQVDERALAGAGRPHDGDLLARVDGAVGRVERDDSRVRRSSYTTPAPRQRTSRSPLTPRPVRRRAARCGAAAAASRELWVAATMAHPAEARLRRSATISSDVTESSSPVGSSASTRGGSLARATARPARASSPPESCAGHACSTGSQADALEDRAREIAVGAARELLSEQDVALRRRGGR